MLDVKNAVAVAKTYVADLFRDQGADSFLLEEVEFEESNNQWLVTISFLRQSSRTTLTGNPMPGFERVYKTVVVDAASGNVKALRIRAIA
jgi:hypothetical protein